MSFSPLDLSPHTWIDFSDSATLFDATSGGSNVTNGVGIARAEDKSGNGRHFTEGTSGNRPTWTSNVQNSLGVARFDGGDRLTSVQAASVYGFLHKAGGSTVFAAIRFGTTANPNEVYDYLGNNGASINNQGVFFRYDDRSAVPANDRLSSGMRNSTSGGSGDNFYFSIRDNFFPANVFGVITVQLDPGNATAANKIQIAKEKGSLAGSNASTRNPSTLDPAFALQIGASGNNALPLTGDFAELVIFNSILSTSDREAMQDYLIAKWINPPVFPTRRRRRSGGGVL